MAFTRAYLKSVGLNDDQIQTVIEAHLEVVNPLKTERDSLKTEAEKVPELQKQIDEAKSGEDYKAKYEKEHGDFEAYKTKVAQDAEREKVRGAYRKLLTDESISEKRLDAIMRVTDFSGMKLDKDGNLQDVEGLKKSINTDWADFKVKTETRPAKVDTPPGTDNGGKPVSRARELADNYYAQKYGAPKSAEKE